jgi:hypothetical protein
MHLNFYTDSCALLAESVINFSFIECLTPEYNAAIFITLCYAHLLFVYLQNCNLLVLLMISIFYYLINHKL